MSHRSADHNSQRNERRIKFNAQGVADWAMADAAKLRDTIGIVSNSNGCLRLGYSRDGGAFAIGIYGDGEPYTIFVPCTDDINVVLEQIQDGFLTNRTLVNRPENA